MSEDGAGTWPEQDAVMAWWQKHRLELCKMVSAYRIEIDQKREAQTEFDGDEPSTPPADTEPPTPIHLETDVVKRIEHFRGLKKDWDSYGAQPIQPGAIALALDLVRILKGTEHEITHASPTNDEVILMDTKSGMGIEASIYGN